MKKLTLSLLLAAGLLPAVPAAERIMVIGDSITGHSINLAGRGYAHVMRRALDEAGKNDVTVVPLGGSGQSVSSWRNVIRNSREKNQQLDIRGIMVKDELDKGADALIIFLGMNDMLAPYTDLARLAQWKAQYQSLIDELKERTKFKRLYLATPTLCGEKESSARNELGRALTAAIAELAAANNAQVIPTGEAVRRFSLAGRSRKPDYLVTLDCVHPGYDGHLALAVALLEGIGQPEAAARAVSFTPKHLQQGMEQPGVVVDVENAAAPGTVTLTGTALNFRPETVSATLPEGWTQEKCSVNGDRFTLVLRGTPEKTVRIPLTVRGGDSTVTAAVQVNPPFLVGTGLVTPRWFKAGEYQASAQATAVDEALKAGSDPAAVREFKGAPVNWIVYYPSAQLTGGNNPDSVDFASCGASRAFETGYAIRYVESPVAQKAILSLSCRVFAGAIYDTVLVNGREVYSGLISGEKGRKADIPVELKAGWNTIALKCAHTTWQYQSAISLRGEDGKALDNLKYSVVFPEASTR